MILRTLLTASIWLLCSVDGSPVPPIRNSIAQQPHIHNKLLNAFPVFTPVMSNTANPITPTLNAITYLLNSPSALIELWNRFIEGNLENLQTVREVLSAFIQAIGYVVPKPTDVTQIINLAANAASVQPNSTLPNIFVYALRLLIGGINPTTVQSSVEALTTFNSMTNTNPSLPNVSKDGDPRFSVDEAILRAAIYIPSTFVTLNASNIPAIVMVPGTAVPGGQTWAVGYAKKFIQDRIANPVWLNIPTNTLQDAQVSAEYVAYAINYISQYTGGRNVSVIAFSQGTINTQWALKYFPSTQKVVSDYIGISPDYRGTVLAQVLCPGFPRRPCPPSILQQFDNSTFVRILRQNGGDAEIVPTTTVYSATDQIVQPQSGPNASGFLLNASNNLIQELCPSQPAGLIYTHEGLLYNALGYALAVDAITNEGHANASRMLANNPNICLLPTIPGLTVDDVVTLESVAITAVLNIVTYFPKQFDELPIRGYATY